jgi:hypothetical protein
MSTTSKTFEFRGGSFSLDQKTVPFMGVDRNIGHIRLSPVLEHVLRVTEGDKDYEGYIRYDIDNS